MAFRDLIRKQRQSGSGILSSVGSAAGASMRESVDIRNILFTRDSLLAALFPNVKGFKADGKTTKPKTSPSSLMSMEGASSGLSDAKLDIIAQNTKIASKNSMVMPSMARDMNVMRQNIIKMVNLSGEKPSTRADAFFLKASEREKNYESQMQETKTTTPTKVDSSTAAGGDKKSFIGKFLSGLLAVLGAAIFLYFTNDKFKDVIDNVVTNIVDSVTNVLDSASKVGLGIGAAGVAGLAAKRAIQKRMTGTGGKSGRGGPGSAGTPGQARPRDKWGRFVKYVQVNNAPLYKKIGTRLATMAVMATVPVLGWVAKALTFVGSLSLAWELFRMWQRLNKEEGEDIGEDTESLIQSQTDYSNSNEFAGMGIQETMSEPVSVSPRPAMTSATSAPVVGMEAGGGTNRSPIPVQQTNDNLTFNSLSRDQQDVLLDKQFEKEGNRPGNLAYDLNNPGAMLWSPKAAQFGAVKDPNRGDGELKGQFARFPTFEQGREAQRDLWSRKYGDLPLNQAINKWTTGKLEGDGSLGVENYKSGIFAALGKSNVSPADSMTRTPGTTVAAATSQLSSGMASSNQQPVVINAPTNNVNNSTSGGGGGGGMPSVVDQDFMRYLVGKMA
jgi:hypothetical protein